MTGTRDHELMGEALAEARLGMEEGEIPIGAVLVAGGRVVGRSRAADRGAKNRVSHAEIRLLMVTDLSPYRRSDLTIYTTLEPCVMCAAAILTEGLGRVVYGLPAALDGGMLILGDRDIVDRCGGRVPRVTGGVREADCRALLQEFVEQPGVPKGMVRFVRDTISGSGAG